MDTEKLEYVDEGLLADDSRCPAGEPEATPDERRLDPRVVIRSLAAVSMPPLTTRIGELREISRGGLFVAFKDAVTTHFEMESAEIDVGAYAEIAFSAPLDGELHRVHLRSRIARVDHKGIGVQYVTHNPPQLGVLRDYLPRVEKTQVPPSVLRHTNPPGRRRQVVKKAPDNSGWQDWQLLD
jgi:hypothetical protein